MANIKIPSKLIFEQMATGQMISMRIYNSRLKKFQTTFVIKDFAKNIEHILNTNTADARCYLDVFGNAASLIYLIGFGENNKFLYNYWFNYYSKSINTHELEDLSYQDTVEYLFVDHKNNMIKVVEIENILVNAAPLYINVAKEINNWTPSEFEELQTNIMKDFKTYRGLWNYITEHMSA
jgi:hypothetical protein